MASLYRAQRQGIGLPSGIRQVLNCFSSKINELKEDGRLTKGLQLQDHYIVSGLGLDKMSPRGAQHNIIGATNCSSSTYKSSSQLFYLRINVNSSN
jgi:hypothetical protein